MKVLGYLPNVNWIDDYIGIEKKLDTYIEIYTNDFNTAEESSKKFEKTYLFEAIPFELNVHRKILHKLVETTKPDIFISPSTNKGRGVLGLYIGITDVLGATDVIALKVNDKKLIIDRLVYGGTGKATLEVHIPCALCISKGYFKGDKKDIKGEIIQLNKYEKSLHVDFKSKTTLENDPSNSDIVIVAGRGFRKKEDLSMIMELSKLLNGAWSVTRPLAADLGWSDNWIGISGLTISPKIYIGIGVSGQPHHIMGARNSDIIIAINKDPDAPIFEEADYGIIGDLYNILPPLIERLKKMKS